MPNIKPISDLRNYTEVLKEVRTIQLLTKLEEGEQSAREKGWLTEDEIEAALGV